jgi:hypothetical protein
MCPPHVVGEEAPPKATRFTPAASCETSRVTVGAGRYQREGRRGYEKLFGSGGWGRGVRGGDLEFYHDEPAVKVNGFPPRKPTSFHLNLTSGEIIISQF